jgi:hypothetical protein
MYSYVYVALFFVFVMSIPLGAGSIADVSYASFCG